MFFFNDTAPTEFYPYGHTLSRHDALPISRRQDRAAPGGARAPRRCRGPSARRTVRAPATGRAGSARGRGPPRSEEHTSELQSLMRISYAVFCLKKNKKYFEKM